MIKKKHKNKVNMYLLLYITIVDTIYTCKLLAYQCKVDFGWWRNVLDYSYNHINPIHTQFGGVITNNRISYASNKLISNNSMLIIDLS